MIFSTGGFTFYGGLIVAAVAVTGVIMMLAKTPGFEGEGALPAPQANAMAARLAAGLAAVDAIELAFPVESNEVFVRMSHAVAEALRGEGFEFHPWPGKPGLYRLVAGFSTTVSEVDGFLEAARGFAGTYERR